MDDIYKSKRQSSKKIILQTEENIGNKKSSLDFVLNKRDVLTTIDLNTKQKLLDFISDKNKLSLKSHFDHRGTKAFLHGKNEAMKKIELNENIEEIQINKRKSDKKIKKKLNKMKSAAYMAKIGGNAHKKNKKKKSISNKYLTNYEKNKIILINKKFNYLDIENRLENSIHKNKKRKSQNKIIIKSDINIDKSINSIETVDSNLFNNKKDYDNYKRLTTKDDLPILKDILDELDSNKK